MQGLMLRIFVAGSVLMAATVSVAVAQDVGKVHYMTACASCHGATGLGDGPMAEFISTKVPDLTLLALANGGAFPTLRVIHIMDGRSGLRGHGSEMPIWGDIFEADAEETGPADSAPHLEAKSRILAVARYLELIQK